MQKNKISIGSSKILISIIVLILVVVGSLAFYKTYQQNNNPSKIVEDIVNSKEYTVDVSYTTKNTRGEFTEEGNISHSNDETKLVLKDKEQIFSKDKIKINYFEGDKHFTVDRGYDEFYRFFLLNELPQYINKKGVKYSQTNDEMTIEFKTDSLNRNFSSIKFIVDLKNKQPKELIILDEAKVDRVTVRYSNFINQVK